MSEKEREIGLEIAKGMAELNDNEKSYVLGVVRGIAMANARSAAAEEKKGA